MGPYTPSFTPFVVPIIVSEATEPTSFTFDLTDDPTQFAIDTSCDPFGGDPYCDFIDGPVTQGPFYGGYTLIPPLFVPGFVFTDSTGRQTGFLSGVNEAWQDIAPALSGDGILAYVEFVALVDMPTTSILVSSESRPASVPEPATVTLIFAAAAFAALRGTTWASRWRARRKHAKRPPGSDA